MDVNFQLKEKTVLILGAFTTTTQSLVKSLTELGSDCVLLDHRDSLAAKFCQQITDLREVNPKNGRAAFLKAEMKNLAQARDIVGRASQVFGGVDVLIDGNFVNQATPFAAIEQGVVDVELAENLKTSMLITNCVLQFFKNRKRGRIVYLMNESFLNAEGEDSLAIAYRTGLLEFAKTLAKQVQDVNVTVNTLSVGITEEYLLGHYPNATTIKEALELHKQRHPNARISDSEKVAQTVLFLVGSMGAVLSGQNLRLS